MTGAWNPLPPLTSHDFDIVRRLASDTCGISLHAGKTGLVSSRLERLVRKYRFDSFSEYVRFLGDHRSSPEFSEFIDNLTTNHSGFWREPEHFTFLQQTVLPERAKGIRIWSAACATGEEPYTLAMCCAESRVAASISASDISRTALTAAMRGEYDEARLAALPAGWRNRYFEQDRVTPGHWRVSTTLRASVRFAIVNLLHPVVEAGTFDIIFCRNVMIYFEQLTRDVLVDRLVQQLVPGGYLFTGHSETLLRLPPALHYVQPATYRKS